MENIIGNINSSVDQNGNIIMKSANSIFCSAFYFQDLYDDRLITKFIKSTEAIIRQSKEYTDYLALVKTNYSMLNYDNILSHISDGDASIEIHHYPLTLYEIVDTVMQQHVVNKDKFTSFSIAKEVMELHFKHLIGFVPLTKTNHELAHSGGLFISTKQVFGDWQKFCTLYEKGLSADVQDKIIRIKALSDANMTSDFKGLY